MRMQGEDIGPVLPDAGPAMGPSFRIFHRRCFRIAMLSALMMVAAAPSYGVVLQGVHLLMLMTDNIGSATSLSVRQKVLLYEDPASGSPTEGEETLIYQFSRACRSESASLPARRIHIVTKDASITVQNDTVIEEAGLMDRYLDLLLFRSRKLLQEKLWLNDVDFMVSSLGRFEGDPVYVLGAQYPDTSKSQIWLDKETFRPLRLLIPQGEDATGKSMLEFRYLQWQKQNSLWYPMRIQCYQNDRLIKEMVVDELIMNPFMMDDVFDIERLKAQYGASLETTGSISVPPVPSSEQE